MGISALIVFFVYTIVMFIGQSVIASKQRIQMVHRREAPARYILHASALAYLMCAYPYATSQQTHLTLVVLGCMFVLAGLALSWWSQYVLKHNWVPGIGLRKQHKLVTTGPYRFVRHPLYSGIAVSSIGLGLCSLNPWFIAAMLSFAAGFAIRCLPEDAMLRKRFPKQYPAYKAATGALVPRLRK